jgi:hypothetical protein
LAQLPIYEDAWRNSILFDEHTWGAFNSIAQPYHPRTAGGIAEKADFAYRAAERAATARAAVLRGAKDYCDFSRTRCLRVLNPGSSVRSGWVEIPATAIRFACNAAKESQTGKVYPLEDIREPEWSAPDLQAAPFDLPNDVWGWQVKRRRFFLPGVAPGQSLDFELLQSQPPESAADSGLKARWDETQGHVASLRTADGVELVDADAPHALGQVVVERLKDRGQRPLLASRDPQRLAQQFVDEPVRLVSARVETTAYATVLSTAWEHPALHRVEQRWEVLRAVPRACLTTTLWTREMADPCALYIALPLSLPGTELASPSSAHGTEEPTALKGRATQVHFVYDSAGHETVFGRDSMPGTCAEALCQNAGLLLRGSSAAVLLATPDTPLGCVGGPMLRRRLVAPLAPSNAHYYINVTNNYWHTNFSIVKAGKLVLRHWLQPVDPVQAKLDMLSDELWAYPIQVRSPGSENRGIHER